MNQKNPNLFDPIQINEVEIKNRVAMAPMGAFGLVTQDGCFSERGIKITKKGQKAIQD